MSTSSLTAVIDLDPPGSVISRHGRGHLAEQGRRIDGGFRVGEESPLPNARGIRSDVVEALRAMASPTLRWVGLPAHPSVTLSLDPR